MAKYLCNCMMDPNSFDEYEESVAIYYNINNRFFEDEDGYPIYDIYRIITPNDMLLFLHNKCYMITKHQSILKVFVEMYYLQEEGYYE